MNSNQYSTISNQGDFLSDGGEMEKLIRTFPWSKTTIGPIDNWPIYLKTSVSIILQSPVPMVIVWGEDGILIYNNAYSAFAGKRHPSLLGSNMVEGWPEVADFNKEMLANVLQGKKLSYQNQKLILYRNDMAEEVYLDLNYSAILDDMGKPAGALAIVVETTQAILATKLQKKAEEALQEEKIRLKDLFMNAPAGIAIITGPNLTFQLANGPYLQLIGKNKDIEGKPLLEVLPEIESELLKTVEMVAFQGERFIANELPVYLDWAGNGKAYTRFLNFIYETVLEDQRPNGLMAFVYDVTEQVQSRMGVEDQNRVLEMITGGSSLEDALNYLLISIEKQSHHGVIGSILLLDKDGKHLKHGAAPSLPNEYNNAINGIAIGDGVGSCGTAAFTLEPVIVTDISKDPLWKDFKDLALKHGLRACWSTPILAGDKLLGTFAMYYHSPHEPSREEKKVVEFTIRTAALAIERKRADESIAEKNKELIKINNDLDNFIYTASHDLKAPVSNIEGLINTLKDKLPPGFSTTNEETVLLLQMIDASIVRFKNTIIDLTEITKIQKTQEEDINDIVCDQVIHDVQLTIYNKIAESNAEIQVEVKDCNSLRFSKKNFTSIIYNLLSNAIKYRDSNRPLKILIEIYQELDNVILRVKDNGLGISKTNIPKLFTMFKRFHDHTEGSGIGLYIVKRIIDNAGGKIEVKSELGQGTEFKIYFKK